MIQQSTIKIYNAAAGSGKTYTLVKEYLSAILSKHDPYYFRHNLAITFTNKAANEMKLKVLKTLILLANHTESINENFLFEELCQDLKLKPTQLRERATQTLQMILHNYADFNIGTIDKFTQKLVRSFSQDLGLSNNYEVNFDIEDITHQAIDVMMNQLSENQAILKYLSHYALEKMEEGNSWNILQDLQKTSKILNEESNYFELEEFKKLNLADFQNLKQTLYSNHKKIVEKAKKLARDFFNLLKINAIEEKSFFAAYVPAVFHRLEKPLTDKSFILSETIQKNKAHKIFYSKGTPLDQKEKIDAIANEIISFLTAVSHLELEFFENNLIKKNISSLAVLNEIEEELTKLSREENILLGSEFNKIIHKELQHQPAPYIYEKIGERYKHYFIDEFQDTSILQWNNLLPLIHNQLAQDGFAMLVGDAKQSIYRWRGGEPEQFMNLAHTGAGFKFETVLLEHNYRSYSTIVNFNTDLYTTISSHLKADDYRHLYQETASQKINHKIGGCVEIKLFDSKEKEKYIENQLINSLNYIKYQHDELGYNYRDICIICREKKQNELIAKFLIDHKIPIISNESLLLAENLTVSILILLFQIQHQPNDATAKFYFFNYLQQLKTLNINDFHAFLNEYCNCSLEKFITGIQSFGYSIEFLHFKNLSLYEQLEYFIQIFSLNQEKNNAFLQYFLDFVHAYQQKKGSHMQGFLNHWELKKSKVYISSPENYEAVQIMTIHKSKGLEYKIVIMPFVDWKIGNTNDKIWIPLVEHKYKNFNKLYVKSNKNLAKFDNEIAQTYAKFQAELHFDNLNLLYVGTTRAVEKLLLLSAFDENKEQHFSKISAYLNAFLQTQPNFSTTKDYYEWGLETAKIEDQTTKIEDQKLQITFHSNHWREKLIFSINHNNYWTESHKKQTQWGNLVHSLLAEIQYNTDIPLVFSKYIQKGLLKLDDAKIIQEKLNTILNHEILKDYYTLSYKILNECDICYQNQIIRPDRIALKENEAIIIDYKTAKPKHEHKTQLKIYSNALKSMKYNTKSFLVYLNEKIYVTEIF